MDKKTLSLILKILKTAISIILCVAATVSMLGATLISVGREYLQSEQFHTQLDGTNLAEIEFLANGQRVTVSDFVRENASKYIADKAPVFFPFSNYVVDNLISSELVNSTVKAEVYELIDYVLNSDADEAKHRIENNIEVRDTFNVNDAQTIEEAISIYTNKFIISNIENLSGMSTDKLIVFLSENTVKTLVITAVVLMAVLVLINITSIFNLLIYGGFVGLLYGTIIKAFQFKFESISVGSEDLIGYVFLKPLADTYSLNANIGFIVGAVLTVLFIGVLLLFKFFVNKKEE